MHLLTLWGQSNKGLTDVLQVMQNKLVQILFNKPMCYPTVLLYKDLKIFNITDLIKFDSVKLVY